MGACLSSQVASLVERQSRYVLLLLFPNSYTQTVLLSLTPLLRHLPHFLLKSLTFDLFT